MVGSLIKFTKIKLEQAMRAKVMEARDYGEEN
jgi:hypothetical protein